MLMVPIHVKNNRKNLLETLFPKNNTRSGVSFIQMPPSVFLTFSDSERNFILSGDNSLRILALGGEKFPDKLLERGFRKGLKVFNLYGITEVSCWASVMELGSEDTDVSLGEALDDTVLEVRNNYGKTIVDGEGEMFIGMFFI